MVAKITYPDATVSEYRYDGGGRRIESVEDNKITKFLYDGLNAVIERDWNNITQARYTRGVGYGGGIGSIVSEERRAQNSSHFVARYYHYDAIGTVTGLSNALGYLTESFTYDAFGNMLGVRNEFKDAASGGYRFSTKESNARSGLVYFGARYYDPKIGRFITPDPLTWGPDDERIFEKNLLTSNFMPFLITLKRGNINPAKVTAFSEVLNYVRNSTILYIGKINPNLLLHRYVLCANNPVNHVDPYGFTSEALSEYFGWLSVTLGTFATTFAAIALLPITPLGHLIALTLAMVYGTASAAFGYLAYVGMPSLLGGVAFMLGGISLVPFLGWWGVGMAIVGVTLSIIDLLTEAIIDKHDKFLEYKRTERTAAVILAENNMLKTVT